VLLFSMDKLEAFPVDRWVKRVAERLFFRGRRLTEREVREWGRKHYGRYAGYAQQYLFHYMRHREG
jgi:N-glycosylase/DNA lyase